MPGMRDREAGLARRLHFKWPSLLTVWVLVLSAWRAAIDPETDIYWMAREGVAVLGGGALRHTDVWGWASTARQFSPTSPLWELMLGASWHLLGRGGLYAVALLTLLACTAAIAWLMRQFGAGETASVFTLLGALVFIGTTWTARAALPALVLLLVELTVVWKSRYRLTAMPVPAGMVRLAIATAATSWLGVWLHNSWTTYSLLAALGMAFLIASFPGDLRRVRIPLIAAAAFGALAGAALGPLGLEAWPDALRVAGACHGLVVEWSSPWVVGIAMTLVWLGLLPLLAFTVPVALAQHPDRPLRVLFFCGAMGSALAGAWAARFVAYAALTALPLVALGVSTASGNPSAWRTRLGERALAPYWHRVGQILLLVIIPLASFETPRAYSAGLDPAFAALPLDCRLFSGDSIGSITALVRPDVRVWIDGRLDYWGRARLLLLEDYQDGRMPTVVPPGTSCVVSSPTEDWTLERLLAADGSWHRSTSTAALTTWLPT